MLLSDVQFLMLLIYSHMSVTDGNSTCGMVKCYKADGKQRVSLRIAISNVARNALNILPSPLSI